MKFSVTQPLAWTDGCGRHQMALLSVEGRGLVLIPDLFQHFSNP